MAIAELNSLLIFVLAAAIIAMSPGPGIFYVAARTLAGGKLEGLASSFGTGLGGFAHIAAGALGVSALVMASAEAFLLLKLFGAAYLLWLGGKAFREAGAGVSLGVASSGWGRAFREGVVVEALNPKTAAFFLAFIPQFIDPAQNVAAQFVGLGVISVALNTAVDVVVVFLAAGVRSAGERRPLLMRRLREGAGVAMCGLGASMLFVRRAT